MTAYKYTFSSERLIILMRLTVVGGESLQLVSQIDALSSCECHRNGAAPGSGASQQLAYHQHTERSNRCFVHVTLIDTFDTSWSV